MPEQNASIKEAKAPSEEHAGLPVHGYKPQSAEAVELVNRNKEIEETILRICDTMRGSKDTFDQRWLAIAVTHLEQGFMALNRAVFKPGRVTLPQDHGAPESKDVA